jgi:prolipoprotein diacylglyceryl transferase
VIEIGPLTLRAYGIMLLLGILAATWLTGRRAVRAGDCDWDFVFKLAMWGVAGGVVGARLYHVATSWDEVPDEWWGFLAVWKGGLGIWGGIAGGVLAGVVVVRRAGKSVFRFMDFVAPALLLAQFVGRLGNYFNQELFGGPTSLPWGLEIDLENRPDAYLDEATFHPTFLYEMLWNGIGVLLVLWAERLFRIRPPGIFCLYVAWYSLGRLAWEEQIRVDPSAEVLGMRLNFWVALGLFVAALAAFAWAQRRRGSGGEPARVPLDQLPAAPVGGPAMALPKGRVRRRG